MTKQELYEILKEPSKARLNLWNHEQNNFILIAKSLYDFNRKLHEEEWKFLGFQELFGELIKVRPYGVSDYAMVFEDSEFDIFWIHTDFAHLVSLVNWLEIDEKEKRKILENYNETDLSKYNLSEDREPDIWDMYLPMRR